MSEIVEFLEARFAEEEADARDVHRGDTWHVDEKPDAWMETRDVEIVGGGKLIARFDWEHGGTAVAHVVRWNPERVLAEVEAKRRIVSRCDLVIRGSELEQMFNLGQETDARDNLRALASVYADHEDYREEWRS